MFYKYKTYYYFMSDMFYIYKTYYIKPFSPKRACLFFLIEHTLGSILAI